MQTVFETRRARLKELIARYGSISALNLALGWDATNPRLSQIQNRSVRSDRGTPYEMGDVTAREIEQRLKLETGWMDTPAGLELYGTEQLAQLHRVAEQLPPTVVDQWIAIGETLAKHAGTSREAEEVKKSDSSSVGGSPHTAQAGTSPGDGPQLARSASARRGGLLDPAARKQSDGAMHEREQDGQRAGKRDGRPRR